VRLLSYNIRYGGRGRERALADVISACTPDVVILQEATDAAVVARLASLTGFEAWGARAGQSLGFLARHPPRELAWRWLPSARHAYLDLLPCGTRWRVIGVHLRAMHANWAERRRVLDARALLRALSPLDGTPHVLTGDFNTLAPGETLDVAQLPMRLRPLVWMSGGRITWQVVEVMQEAGYVDGWVAAGSHVPGVTFPTWGPHLRLDYAFTPAAYRDALTQCGPVTDAPGAADASDHLPLLVVLEE
jgi:exodeoxyribonuclease-3